MLLSHCNVQESRITDNSYSINAQNRKSPALIKIYITIYFNLIALRGTPENIKASADYQQWSCCKFTAVILS